ncbi:hypothetical protein, partial [Paenibacillus sp. MMO-58]|uniref:hypothetical protein n=1 Tax=Paenibacillus sp. MMO-58 TaxID=3081290 RepID=UPI0030162F80
SCSVWERVVPLRHRHQTDDLQKDIQFFRIALSKLTTSERLTYLIYPIIIVIGYFLRKEVIQPHLPIRL